jgi:hypothetical protein
MSTILSGTCAIRIRQPETRRSASLQECLNALCETFSVTGLLAFLGVSGQTMKVLAIGAGVMGTLVKAVHNVTCLDSW